ncbi:unnamed protein product, partial [Prorocentrum cordatum]
ARLERRPPPSHGGPPPRPRPLRLRSPPRAAACPAGQGPVAFRQWPREGAAHARGGRGHPAPRCREPRFRDHGLQAPAKPRMSDVAEGLERLVGAVSDYLPGTAGAVAAGVCLACFIACSATVAFRFVQRCFRARRPKGPAPPAAPPNEAGALPAASAATAEA